MATPDSDDNTQPQDSDSVSNPPNALVPAAPAVCLLRFATDSAGGALMGSVFGYGSFLLFLLSHYAVVSFTISAFFFITNPNFVV